MDKFRVGLDEDMMKADRSPKNPAFDFSDLENEADLEFVPVDCEGYVQAGHVEDLDAILLGGVRLDAQSFHPNRRLAIAARSGVGYDMIDPDACTAAGVALSITPDGVRRPVAVASLALMLAATHRLYIKDRITREDRYMERDRHNGMGLDGRTLGSLGLGSIGSDFFRLAQPLNMRCIAHDPFVDSQNADSLGVTLVDIDTLFRESDVDPQARQRRATCGTDQCFHDISSLAAQSAIAVKHGREPSSTARLKMNEATRFGIVSAERIASMKPTAFFVNTARGGLVDQKALTAALAEGRLAGARRSGSSRGRRRPRCLGGRTARSGGPDPQARQRRLEPARDVWHRPVLPRHLLARRAAPRWPPWSAIAVKHGREPKVVVNRAVAENPDWQAKLKSYVERFGA